MSTDNHKDHLIQQKQLSDDEAFIQTLYDDIASADTSIDEQPSKATDDKILAAAHRALSSSPKLVVKNRSWTIPIASAASVMLVFSLFFNQLNDDALQSEMLPAPALMSAQPKSEMLKKMAARQKEVKQKHRQMKRTNIPARGDKKQQEVARLTAQDYLMSDSNFSAMAESEAKPIIVNEAINVMTEKVYQQLLSVNRRWIFVKEEKEFYVIQLVSKEQENVLYKLDKREYYVSKSMQKIIIPRTLQELGLLSED